MRSVALPRAPLAAASALFRHPRAAPVAAVAASAPATSQRSAPPRLRASRAVSAAASAPAAAPPVPTVTIDNLSDPLATIVEVSYGDLLGELLDTIQSLKNLGLDITRASISEGKANANRFFITDAKTSDKIVTSERLEEIRASIINNMLAYHPESRDSLAAGAKPSSAAEKSLGARPVSAIPTAISVRADPSGARSALRLTTTDRPGLLVDVVRVLKDCSLNVISANINTVGLAAQDTFYVTYHGKALTQNMEQLVTNALQYYLSMAEIETNESY